MSSGSSPEGLVPADVVDGAPVLSGESVVDSEELRRGENRPVVARRPAQAEIAYCGFRLA